MPRIVKKGPARLTEDNLVTAVQEFLNTQALHKQVGERLSSQKSLLMEYVEENGVEDDKGHRRVVVDGIGTIKRERRVSSTFDEEFTERWLQEADLWDECTTTITVVDEDAVLGLIYNETIPDEVGRQMFSDKETFAFRVDTR